MWPILNRLKPTRPVDVSRIEDNKTKTLEALERYHAAQKELEERCKELGISVPEITAVTKSAVIEGIPKRLVEHILLHLYSNNINSGLIINHSTKDAIEKNLIAVWQAYYEHDWDKWKPRIHQMTVNRVVIFQVYLGSVLLAELSS